jgi:hypothetical protein
VGERCRSRRKRRRWSRGHAGRRVSEFAKANAAASKTTASDRRARGGGEIDTLAEASGAVLAAKWGEAAEEHGGDVFGWWCVGRDGGSACAWSGREFQGEITPA